MQKLLILFSIATLAQLAKAQTGTTPTVITVPSEGAQVNMTIARNDTALVSDRRAAALPAGRSVIRFTDLPSPDKLGPVAVIQPFISGPGTVEILEQRFQDALTSGATETIVLARYVGQTVTLLREQAPAVKGTLLMVGNMLMLDTADGVMINPKGTFVVPRLAGGVADKPTTALTWLVNVATAGQYSVEARYVTKGLNWLPYYHAAFNAAGDRLTLRGWLKVDNDTQVHYRGVQLSLQQGKINEATPIFKYPRPVDLAANFSQQLAYVAAEIPAARELIFQAAQVQADFTRSAGGAPQISLRLRNTADIGLGLPLPAGPLTVWGTSPDGTPIYLADRSLPDTEPNQELRLKLGDAPKVSVSREVTNSRQLNPRTMEHTIQITVSNQRKEAVTVLVLEDLPGGAKITESAPAPTLRQNETQAEYRLTVPASGSVVVKYVVEVKR